MIESIRSDRPDMGSSHLTVDPEAMRRMLVASSSTCSLSVASYNSSSLRDSIIRVIKRDLPREHSAIRVLSVPKNTENVFEFARDKADGAAASAIFLIDLDLSLPSNRNNDVFLRALNTSRELWQETFECPIVFWLPKYAVTMVFNQARDFWRWVNHVFEFLTPQAGPTESVRDRHGVSELTSRLPVADRPRRIDELDHFIANAHLPDGGTWPFRVALWLNEKSFLQLSLAQLGEAEHSIKQALEVCEGLRNKEPQAQAFANMGSLMMRRGETDEAERYYHQALHIDEESEHLEGLASDYDNLGTVNQARGDPHLAKEMHRKALDLNQKVNRREGIAQSSGNLGLAHLQHGQLKLAQTWFTRSLKEYDYLQSPEGKSARYRDLAEVCHQLGDDLAAMRMLANRYRIERQLGWRPTDVYAMAGTIALKNGDFARAQRRLERGLKMEKSNLRRPQMMAWSYNKLAEVCEASSDFEEAEKFNRKAAEFEKSWSIFVALARNLYDESKFSDAEEYHRIARDLAADLGKLEELAESYAALGRTLLREEEYDKAYKSLDNAREIARELDAPAMMAECCEWMGKAMDLQGEGDAARELWHEAKDLYTRIESHQKALHIDSMIQRQPREGGH